MRCRTASVETFAATFAAALAAALAVGAVGLDGFVSTAHAADVTWVAPATITGDTDVSTAGTLFAAYNFGESPVSELINTVTFDPFAIVNGSATVTHGSLTIKGFQGTLPINSAAALGSSSAPFSSKSANYQALLSTGAVESTSPPILDLTFSGLTVGTAYTVQIWSNDSGATFGGGQVGVSDFNGDFSGLDSNTTNTNGGVGQSIKGSFVADATTEFFSVSSGGAGGSAILNAIQLRETPAPEPATLSLIGVTAVMMLRRRA